MKQRTTIALATGLLLLAVLWTPAFAEVRVATLNSYQEVPALSTTGVGQFKATISSDDTTISYELTYSGLEGGTVSFAHIHFGQVGVSGGVIAFLCGGGSKSPCPSSGTVTGMIVASDVTGPSAQGIASGELTEVLRAMRRGRVYANVHTTTYSNGEIRGQIK